MLIYRLTISNVYYKLNNRFLTSKHFEYYVVHSSHLVVRNEFYAVSFRIVGAQNFGGQDHFAVRPQLRIPVRLFGDDFFFYSRNAIPGRRRFVRFARGRRLILEERSFKYIPDFQ